MRGQSRIAAASLTGVASEHRNHEAPIIVAEFLACSRGGKNFTRSPIRQGLDVYNTIIGAMGGEFKFGPERREGTVADAILA